MSILVKELGKHVENPTPPYHLSRPARAAFDRGVRSRARHPRPSLDRNPYSRRYMRRAWIEGWDAMNAIIKAAK